MGFNHQQWWLTEIWNQNPSRKLLDVNYSTCSSWNSMLECCFFLTYVPHMNVQASKWSEPHGWNYKSATLYLEYPQPSYNIISTNQPGKCWPAMFVCINIYIYCIYIYTYTYTHYLFSYDFICLCACIPAVILQFIVYSHTYINIWRFPETGVPLNPPFSSDFPL